MEPTYEPANGTNIGRELINSRSIPNPTGFRCSSEIRGQTGGWIVWKSGTYFLYSFFSILEFWAIVEWFSLKKNRRWDLNVCPMRGDRKMEKRKKCAEDAYLN
mgnify:CR=1 FL=1